MGWGADSITDPSHVKDRVRFAKEVSEQTGLSFPTVWGWTAKEGGSFRNPLGVNYAGGQNPPQYADTEAAVKATVSFLQGSNYAGLRVVAQKKFPSSNMGKLDELASEARAIASSPFGPWGTNLTDATLRERQEYAAQIIRAGGPIAQIGWDADKNRKLLAGTGLTVTGGAADDVKGKVKGVTKGIDRIAEILGWPIENPWRTLEILGGSALLLIGLVLVAKQAGAPMPSLPFQRGSGSSGVDPLDQAFQQGVQTAERANARAAGRASVASDSATVTGSESTASVRRGRLRSETAAIGDDVPF